MGKKTLLGVYFSDNFINIVEQKGGKVVNFAKVACGLEPGKGLLSRTVVDETRLVAAVKEEVLKANILSHDAVLALQNRDLVVRFFEIPIVPNNEIASAVGFEAKKYIPFKLEELIFDFQTRIDRKAKKITVFFVAVKRDVIDRYVSILEQVGFKIAAIEPAFLSTLRTLKSADKALNVKAPVAVVDINLALEQANITVVENFYPCFNRDLNLKTQPEKETAESADVLPKLISEVRISLDYCRRQFPLSPININKIMLLSSGDLSGWAETVSKELEITASHVNIQDKFLSLGQAFDAELVKAYGVSLRDSVVFPVKVDLFAKLKAPLSLSKLEAIAQVASAKYAFLNILSEIDKPFLALNLLGLTAVIFFTYILGIRQVAVYKNELTGIKEIRETVPSVANIQSLTYSELEQLGALFDKKIALLADLGHKRAYFTDKLSVVPALIQKGLWLESFNFEEIDNLQRLTFKGSAYLNNERDEFSAINRFLSELKKAKEFSDFKDISLGPLSHSQIGDYYVTDFEINCR